MKTLLITFALSLISTLGFSQDTKGQTITVTVENVKSNTRKVSLSLHTKDTFMKGPGIQNTESKIENGKATVTFTNVVSGEYAIMVLHDENENNRMDFNANGMPQESYATSNNPESFGPPQYNDSKFNIADEAIDLKIRL
jgi:uncharacterized protein (DUF2141 family)